MGDQQNYAIQSMRDTKTTVNAMKVGVKEFKKEHKNFDIGAVEDLQDELEDMLDETNEIQEIMGRQYGMPDIDDDELEAEFAALDLSDASYLDDAISAPSVPGAAPGEASTNKDGVL